MSGKYSFSRKRSKKPVIMAAVAVLLAAGLLGGVYAWYDFTQSRTNKFHGTKEPPDVTLHDEFDGVNKDVFVENSGTSIIYVRVRLDEFMQVGDTVFGAAQGVRIEDKSTWVTHTYDKLSIEDCGHVEPGCLFHDYYKWTMSGDSRYYRPGLPGVVYGTLGNAGRFLDKDDGHPLVDDGDPTNLPADAGTRNTKQMLPAARPMLLSDALWAVFNQGTKSAGETRTQAQLLTAISVGVWLLDDSPLASGGGWAYWSQPLQPKTATNMLLDKVERTAKEPDDEWIYRIDVKLQAVTATDFAQWGLGGNLKSTGADQLIAAWLAQAATPTPTAAPTTTP